MNRDDDDAIRAASALCVFRIRQGFAHHFNLQTWKKCLAEIEKALSMTRNLCEVVRKARLGFFCRQEGSGRMNEGNGQCGLVCPSRTSRHGEPSHQRDAITLRTTTSQGAFVGRIRVPVS
jgi:hypothetical protein